MNWTLGNILMNVRRKHINVRCHLRLKNFLFYLKNIDYSTRLSPAYRKKCQAVLKNIICQIIIIIIKTIIIIVIPRGGSSPTNALSTVYYYKKSSRF